jgi:hypothetical protein
LLPMVAGGPTGRARRAAGREVHGSSCSAPSGVGLATAMTSWADSWNGYLRNKTAG